jgi:glycosyltransferase involved in cell wall biosynthesis
MKIAFVIDQLDRGGAEQQLVALCLGLKQRRHDVHVVSIYDRLALRGDLDAAGIPIVVAPRRNKYDVATVWRLRRVIDRIGPDLVHAYLPAASTLAPLSQWFCGSVPVLQSERGINDWRSPWRLRLENLLRKKVVHITCNVEAIKRHLIDVEQVPAGKITVIYNGLRRDRRERPDLAAIERARRNIGAPADATIVVCVANFSPIKQHDVLIDAFAEARTRIPGLFLVLVGTGPLESRVRARIAALKVEAACRIVTDSGNPLAILAAGHIGALTSRLEGCSNAILEAMAAGLPIVASDTGGNGELVVHGQGGLVPPVGDVAGFARAFVRLASDRAAAAAMGRYNRRRIADHFTDDVMVDRSVALYHAILDRAALRVATSRA